MKICIACILIVLCLTLPIATAADTCVTTPGECVITTVPTTSSIGMVHIMPRDKVYYGDVVSLDGILGWTNTLAWWASDRDPALDPPGAYLNITPTRIPWIAITSGVQAGMWYQWYGHNEVSPSPVFLVVPRVRPTPTAPGIGPILTPAPPAARIQPEAIADFLVAKGDRITIPVNESRVWLIGPVVGIMGQKTMNNRFILDPAGLPVGKYVLILQAPDSNGVFEVIPGDNQTITSVWKGVDGFWYAPLGPEVFKRKLMEMFKDTAHFHGSITERTVIVEDQSIDVTSLETAPQNRVVVRGTTNVALGDAIAVFWDEDKHFLAEDRAKFSTTTTAQGDDVGASRVFMAVMTVDLGTQPVGNHFITLYTPDRHSVGATFYVEATFGGMPVPEVTIHYLNNSPFLPAPAPIIIEKEVQVPVTVAVLVTPAYETVLQAQTEAAEVQHAILVKNIMLWIGMACIMVCVVIAGRYLITVVKRARVA